MKPDLRWQILLAAAGFILVVALLSFQVQSAALCSITVPAAGGVVRVGIVGRPAFLNPLLSDSFPVDRTVVDLLFDGLVTIDESGQAIPALAESWNVSEDGLSIEFQLREDATWHDGQPVTATDVAFTYSLLQSEGFPGPESLKTLWQAIDVTTANDHAVTLTMAEPYAPLLEAAARGILPQHLLADVSAENLMAAEFWNAPVGTGPFIVEPGQGWQRGNRLRLLPAPTYWSDGFQISSVELVFFSDEAELLTAYQDGDLEAISYLSPVMLSEAGAVESLRLFTALAPRYSQLLFNMTDTASPAVASVEMRQALATGLNRQQLIDDVMNGQGVMFDGPYLPESWAFSLHPATEYSTSVEAAVSQLEALGWLTADSTAVRHDDEGQPLQLRLVAYDTELNRALAKVIAEQWGGLGVEVAVALEAEWEVFLRQLSAGDFDVALTEVQPPADPDLYDFWSQQAIVTGQNYAGWNNRQASEALEQGRQVLAPEERRPYYETFQRHFEADIPALALFQMVSVYGLDASIQQAEIGRITRPRDLFSNLPDWFLNYRDIAVSCPADG